MRSLVYLSICLLVPVVFILALASRTPKFDARYLMMVSPAYLLIVAGGIGALVSRPTHNALRLLAAVLLVFLVFVSAMSLRNWFTNPAFTKAQWRQAAAAVRKRIAADETVVLVSGHAWPAWDYYAPDIPRVRLPDIDILDVDAVLGFGDGQALQGALAGKSGVWLLRWQDEAVDPVGFVPYFLDRAGREEPFSGQYWHLSLRHWRLRSDASFPTEPHPAHADGANFSHKLALLGWDDPANGMITLYWRTINLMDRDFKVSLILLDAAGREVGRWDGRPAGYNYPTTRWRVGQALFGTIPLPLPAGAAPGDYSVTIAVYDDVDPSGLDIRDVGDNPAGKRVRLGPFKVNGG